MKSLLRSTLIALLLSGQCMTAAWAVDEAAFNTAFTLMQKARAGDGKAVDEAVEAFARLARQEPANPLLRAYQGSAESLQGREAMMPWNKLKLTESGLATIDKALQQLTAEHERELVRGVPIVLETRLVAASTFLALPDMFKRSPAGHQQLQALITHPGLLAAPDGFRKAVVELALKTGAQDKLPAERIALLQQLASSSAPQREAAQNQIKDAWK